MKKFSFKLEPVLKLKEKILKDKMLELAKITRILSDAQNTLTDLMGTQSQTSEDIMHEYLPGQELNICSINIYREYLAKVMNEIKNQEVLIQQIQQVVKLKQKEVSEALKERDILEKLKEKQLKKHNEENDHKERVELDDIAISRYKAS